MTNQSVEALPGVAGVRWYEIRRTAGAYSVYQQGTYAPADGVHRWMGSDRAGQKGNMASATACQRQRRLSRDPLHRPACRRPARTDDARRGHDHQRDRRPEDDELPLGRLHLDERRPVDDCTFWYVNEYYTAAGQASSTAGWQTRIGSFENAGLRGQTVSSINGGLPRAGAQRARLFFSRP